MKSWKAELIRSRAGRKVLERAAGIYDSHLCTPEKVGLQGRNFSGRGNGFQFSVAIPHFNRGSLIHRPLHHLLDHPAVKEVIIVDDGSAPEEFSAMENSLARLGVQDRIRVIRRSENRGALRTKLECVRQAVGDWVLVLDSDNTAFRNYLDRLAASSELRPDTFYGAAWGFPYFPFHELTNVELDFEAASRLTVDGLLRRVYVINDGNYLVPRDAYVSAVSRLENIASDVADVMVVNYLWLSLGNRIRFLPGTAYFHRVDPSSFWCRTEDESRKRVLEIFSRLAGAKRWDEEFATSLKTPTAAG